MQPVLLTEGAVAEIAVVMVTDVVDSTALASRLGRTKYDEFRQEHDSILRDAAEDSAGRVVKSTGDGFLVVFPSVAAALDAAVCIQQRVERRNRGAEVQIGVRIGISIGDATVEDGDYFGIPSIEAARLCAQARGGEILIADLVRAVLRGQARHELQSAGVLTLKGLPETVGWKVLWTPLPKVAGPLLPPRLRRAPDIAYVGRGAERALLLAKWDRAAAGDRQVVLISGEAGIGKTRLVTQTAQTGLPDDALVLYGRCDEDQGVPYYPWLEVLGDYVHIAPRRMLRPHAGELSKLIPDLCRKLGIAAAPKSADPDTERYLLFKAVEALLAAASEQAPVLVILDDLHWADRPTLLLLKHLVASSTDYRLLLLATYRESDIGPDHPLTSLLSDLYRESSVARLPLAGLDPHEIVEFIDEMAGHPVELVGLTLAREVHRETAGNPFFAGELLRHLTETGVIAKQADGRWALTGTLSGHRLPPSVREVIGRRVQRLSDETRVILSVASVIGSDFDHGLLSRAANVPEARVLDLLDEAITASLLTKTSIGRASTDPAMSDVYSFSHGLVQATLYDALSTSRRTALHRAVGEAIEAMSGEEPDARLPELAHHFLAAIPASNDGRAVHYATRAGWDAMRQFAYDQAAALFAKALAASRLVRERPPIALLQALGDAQMRAGDSEAARRTLLKAADAARRQNEPEALARAARACGIWGLSPGVDYALVGLAEEAIERLEGRDCPRLIAELKGLLAAALHYAPATETERRTRLAVEALASARGEYERAGDRQSAETLAYVIGRYLHARHGPDSATQDSTLADELFELCRELLDLCRELGDVELELLARHWRTAMLLEIGDFAAHAGELAWIEHMATELRQPRATVFLPLHRGQLAVTTGRFAEAERLNSESVEIAGGVPGSLGGLAASTQMLLLRLQQGRLPEVEAQVRAMADAYPDIVAIRSALVVLLLQAERHVEARVEFERIVAPGLASLPRDNTHITMLALLAEAATELHDEVRAKALYDWLLPFRGRWVVLAITFILWPVDRSLGQLAGATGSVELALSHLATARRQAEQADALPSLALIFLDEARLLWTRGGPADAERSSQRARQASLLSESLGMRHVNHHAAQLLAEFAARGAETSR
jgi:class 3 adenylate cyclase/tetratricopeptide (TPR) repeat protein